ncbi:MAG TPA: helix-turn-helix transcriptional regulator [Verrucomicrobiae bacterium]|nr:helix-turn-helix transcriptional regulator [Verrucomicrobiae bacterium]
MPETREPHERIRELRENRSLSMQKVARALNVSERTVLRHELGQTPLSNMHLRAYADFYDVPVEYLTGEIEVAA